MVLFLTFSFAVWNPDQQFIVSGSILVFVEHMDDEFTKILLNTDARSTL